MVDEVGADVEVLVGAVEGGDLGARHDRDPVLRSGAQGFGDAVDRIVVGEGEPLDAGGSGGGHHLGRGKITVGPEGVGLQIEGGTHRR